MLCSAVACLLASAEPASAAWNNVFQATLWHRNNPVQANYYAVPVAVPAAPTAVYSSPVVAYSNPCCDPCPKTTCSTSYVQRCFYQPVTVMQTKSYYEPVTTMQTSYYYEPVTSYRYSCYYDPCTCSYQQVAVPTTSYCLKAKSCPVQSWVQKCCQVPVTTYQKSCYWEPQTTCCTTTPGAPIYNGGVAPPNGGVAPAPTGPPPVSEQKIPGPPPVQQEKYYGPSMGEGSQTKTYGGYWQGNSQPALGNPIPSAKPLSQPPAPKSPISLEKFASLKEPADSIIQGQVVSHTNAPKPHMQLVFVAANQQTAPRTASANAAGQFNVALTSGQWTVYIEQANGQKTYHSKIQIADDQPSYLTLVSK
jgi:hypothetical protein